ncbi:hypothetical protein AgCh_028932 [Apium graveolens]
MNDDLSSTTILHKFSGKYFKYFAQEITMLSEMIKEAIATLKERTGSSQYAITKFLREMKRTYLRCSRSTLVFPYCVRVNWGKQGGCHHRPRRLSGGGRRRLGIGKLGRKRGVVCKLSVV